MAFSSICTLNSNLVRTKPNSVKPFLMLAGGGSTTTNALSSSYNGLTWNTFGTAPFYFPFPTDRINTFATNGTILVAGGGNGSPLNSLCYSNDSGITWTGLGISIFSYACYGMVYNPNSGMFVAVGQGTNSIAYSYNGINWTGLGTTLFTTGRCIDYIGGYYIAGAITGTHFLATSPDGINWTGIGKPLSTSGIYGIASCRPNPNSSVKWVAVGSGSVSIPTVIYSTDSSGGNWTNAANNTLLTTCYGITYNGTKWILCGGTTNGTSLAKSDDGSTWSQIAGVQTGNAQAWAITNDGSSTFVAVGNGSTLTTSTNIVVSTDNGVTWSQKGLITTSNGAGGGPMFSVIWFNNSFIIGSNSVNRAFNQYMVISLSSPFTTIVGLSKTQTCSISGIATNGTNIVLSSFGGQNCISTSTDKGNTWVTLYLGTGTNSVGGVHWASAFNKFICVINQSLYTSDDGIIWTQTNLSSIMALNSVVRGIAASDPSGVILNSGANSIVSTVVMGTGVSGNNLYVSTNLSTWNAISSGLSNIQSVCWSPILNIFIAVGQGTTCLIYSTNNGVSWTGWTPPTPTPVTLGNWVSWSTTLSQFVVCGEQSAFAYSYNGINWFKGTSSATGFGTPFSCVWNSSLNKWFAIGSTNILASSSDGITWNAVTQSTIKVATARCAIQVLPGF